jgi:predicted HAD superfamily Cof-like phosphohydrolase
MAEKFTPQQLLLRSTPKFNESQRFNELYCSRIPDLYDDVRAFHQKFGFDLPRVPTRLKGKKRQVKFDHVIEELHEYWRAAYASRNPRKRRAHELDAIVDLIYVALGIAVLSGYDNFNEAWKRVHTANMSKVRATRKSQSKRGTTFDVVKPPNFKAPELEDLV